MTRGGARNGAGRKLGVPNKASAAREAELAASGLTPLEHMMNVLRDPTAPQARRDDMAKAAAPYVHPRLSQVESRNEHVHRYVARVPAKAKDVTEWEQRHELAPTIQ